MPFILPRMETPATWAGSGAHGRHSREGGRHSAPTLVIPATPVVIPAQAGIQLRAQIVWIPAYAGMTNNRTP